MAYTPLPTKVDNDPPPTGYLTAAEHNTYVSANFAAIPPAIYQAKGDLYAASGADAGDRLAVGANGQVLIADSTQALGVRWGLEQGYDLVQAKGDLIVGSALNTIGRLAVGTNDQALTADSTQALGLRWRALTLPALFTAKGDLAVGNASGAPARLAVGANDQVLIADSTQALGVRWGANPVADVVTTKGDIVVGTAADTVGRLAVGANGQSLRANSATATGLEWATLITTQNPVAHYRIASAPSIPNASDTILNYATMVYDTDSAVTTGAAWKFTAPAGKGGVYIIAATAFFSTASWSRGQTAQLRLYKNGAFAYTFGMHTIHDTGSFSVFVTGWIAIWLTAGDYVDVRVYQDSGGARTITNDATFTHVSIFRTGIF